MEVKIKKTFDKKLKKDFEIVLPKELIAQKIENYIEKIKGNVSLNGFRKGQVPVTVIKEKYGKSIMADEVEKLIDETIKKIVKDNSIRLALQPKADVKKIEYNQDVSLVVSMEIFPEVPEIDLKKIKVVKREVVLEQSDIDEAVNKFARLYGTWDKQDQSYKAKLKEYKQIKNTI